LLPKTLKLFGFQIFLAFGITKHPLQKEIDRTPVTVHNIEEMGRPFQKPAVRTPMTVQN
jgi:hypothetical protein